MNVGAQHVYERVGFVHEGTLRRAAFREGVHRDVHRMAILAQEWRALAAREPEAARSGDAANGA